MQTRAPRRASWLALPLVLLAGCSWIDDLFDDDDDDDGPPAVRAETEPNDTTATADPLPIGTYGVGDVDVAADVDYWRITLASELVLQFELFATRFDQEGWQAGLNIPRLTVLDTDGVTKLLEHDYSGNFNTSGWSWGFHDLDMPILRIPAGQYFVCITQDDQTLAGGEYAVRVRRLTPGTIQEEDEPPMTMGGNDTSATAEMLAPGVLKGFHVDDESDFFEFDVTASSVVRFELRVYRNGVWGGDDDYFDPELSLYDTDGTTVLLNDDDSFFYDSAIQFKLDVPGTYFIEVLECCGDGDGEYYLYFEREDVSGVPSEVEPNDDPASASAIAYGGKVTGTMDGDPDYFAFMGTAGDMVRLQVFDQDNFLTAADDVSVTLLAPDGVTALSVGGFGQFQVLTTILQESGRFLVLVEPDATPVVTDYCLGLERFKSAGYESEPNDDISTADTFDSNRRAAGVIGSVGDVDVFRFTSSASRVWTVFIYADTSAAQSDGFFEYSGHGSDLDPVLSIRNAAGNVIATSDTSLFVGTEGVIDGLPVAAVSFLATAQGTYYAEVTDAGGDDGGPSHYYVIERR